MRPDPLPFEAAFVIFDAFVEDARRFGVQGIKFGDLGQVVFGSPDGVGLAFGAAVASRRRT